MKEERVIFGTPPPVMFPANNYKFKIKRDNCLLVIPRAGTYHDLDPDFFPEDSGDFNILDKNSNTLYLPSITKVLFATKSYPALEDNNFFVPYALVFEDDVVKIVGQVVEFVTDIEDGDENEEK